MLTSLIGWSGILLNNRAFLAWYTFLLWICFALLVTPGYITYKKRTFNLEGKINAQWSRVLGIDGRLRIQNQLRCCGYFSPFVEATVSQTCFSRSILPGCKSPYLKFERLVLERWYTVCFAIVPAQLLVMVTALLCSNHVTYRFGKGMMPKAYRLNMNSMAVIMDNYAKYVQLSCFRYSHHANGWTANSPSSTAMTSPPRSSLARAPTSSWTRCPPCPTATASRHPTSGPSTTLYRTARDSEKKGMEQCSQVSMDDAHMARGGGNGLVEQVNFYTYVQGHFGGAACTFFCMDLHYILSCY